MTAGGPISAFVLGWAGVIPFAAFSLAAVLGVPVPVPAGAALLAYGAAILSFMGGAQWGVAMRAPDGFDRGWSGYAVSVVPALLAWAGLLVAGKAGLGLLIAGFAGLLAYDLWTIRRGYAPGWYASLRWQLTTAVVVLLGLALVAG
ncbi:DUF3429 domain-containing protein [uncultured Methylobacterium sp.]|jgi:hypothetical protein|uniref:DUF3429 domain-containing protein n=1 Tax=uncultured Methylobacterium sp. TaxID=157278 RepID=UPI00260F65C4|nr:DUF3429 domain-containing protein [uncultured Methylobacterium sp.]